MYNTAKMAAAVAALVNVSIVTPPATAATSCTAAELNRTYGLSQASMTSGASVGEGLITFDGTKSFIGRETAAGTDGGLLVTSYSVVGTYAVNANCSMDMKIDYKRDHVVIYHGTLHGVIVNGGAKINMIFTAFSPTNPGPVLFVLEAL